MNTKSNHPKQKRAQMEPNQSQNTIEQLMSKAKMTQSKREQLIRQRYHSLDIKKEHICSHDNNQVQKSVSNQFKQEQNLLTLNPGQSNNPHLESRILQQSQSYNSSYRPFESNRTLEPYLINIKQEYICGVTEPNKEVKQEKSIHPISNNESIQLSESRQVSEEMLLHNSTTSKFLESPSLSLGLVESKITKKEVDSENNTKILKKKEQKHNEFQSTGHILFLSSSNEQIEHKLPIKVFQQKEMIIKIDKKDVIEQKDASQQFPQNDRFIFSTAGDENTICVQQKKSTIPFDQQLSNSIMTSYQMEVEYLRKINLYQSFQIQKLRKLIRTQENNQSKSIQNCSNQPNLSKKHNFNKKAIDILKRRQTLNKSSTQFIEPLKQKDINIHHPNTSIDNTTEVQFICGDQDNKNHRKSVSFSTKTKLTTAETFHSLGRKSVNNPKAKMKKKSVSIYSKQNQEVANNTFENPSSRALNHNSQILNIDTQQMMNSSMGRHNLSCSTYFMTTKTTNKKSIKSKSAYSQTNLSTIISSSNKENNAPKQSNKNPTKKGTKKQSILQKDMEMFVSTKKHAQHLLSVNKKKK